MSELSVSEVLPALLAALAQSPQVLLAAPTGAGKSTGLPRQLLQQAQLPGQIIMLEPRRLAARNVAQLLRDEPGSLLLFLPGVAEIERVKRELASRVSDKVDLSPLYGALSLEAQRRAILPAAPGRRKVVLATNIAETSLTIEGIRLVVDSALERAAQFDVRSGVTRLLTQRISQASMTQRAGRAGRLAPGICLHLLPQEQALRAAAQSEPEILTSDLASLQLDLLQWGCQEAAQRARP